MINFGNVTKENISKRKQIFDHPYTILIIGGSGSVKKIHNLIKQVTDEILIKLIYMLNIHMKQKYQLLINKGESIGLKHLNDSKGFIKYSNYMDDIYKNIEEYNPNKKRKILIVFDYMIADILSNKNLNPIVTELFSRSGKLNISVFISQFYFGCTKKYKTKFYVLFYYENSK